MTAIVIAPDSTHTPCPLRGRFVPQPYPLWLRIDWGPENGGVFVALVIGWDVVTPEGDDPENSIAPVFTFEPESFGLATHDDVWLPKDRPITYHTTDPREKK